MSKVQLYSDGAAPFPVAKALGHRQADADQRMTADLISQQNRVEANILVSSAPVRLSINETPRFGEAIMAAAGIASNSDAHQPGFCSEVTHAPRHPA